MWRGFLFIFVGMKHIAWIGLLVLLTLSACDSATREARRMVKRAEQLADTLPDSTARLIDSVLRMPANFSERERMDMALLQAEALFGCRDGVHTVSTNTLSPLMDDDFFDDHDTISTSPELERAAAYYAGKKHYAKAAHAALYSGFVQQHYNEKEAAMRSFKEAEQYGKLAIDSLTVARAEYWMGKMLYEDYMEDEALSLLISADKYFEKHLAERAILNNLEAAAYMVLKELDSADLCLQKSLAYAEQSQYRKAKRKALNNYAVYYHIQGDYVRAITYLRQITEEPRLTDAEKTLLYLNLGNSFAAYGATDSATVYYQSMDEFQSTASIKDDTKVSAYSALSRFAESKGDVALALQYLKTYEKLKVEVLSRNEKKYVFRILRQFDYESLQNEMNRKLIRKQRLITLFGILTIIGLVVLAVSQIRLAKIRKKEAKTNANLFHFMQKNKALVESNMAHEKKAIDTMQQLSDVLMQKFFAMLKLDYYLKNQGDKSSLRELEKDIFEGKDHLEAVMELFTTMYPDMEAALELKYPSMNDLERKVYLLSRFRLSRVEEASLLGISTSVLDKVRGKVRKMVENE